ncbi:MAG: zinc-dependent metalloprotease [Parafilimonas sp.]|nr:zinc-dependent metalloprotease [Parafilimonas sp.]
MKKFTLCLPVAIFFATIFNCTQAQKIYTAKQNVAAYAAKLSSNETVVKQMVHEEFMSHKEITVIDFTNTATKESPSYKSSLQKFLKSEAIFSINNATEFVNTIQTKPTALTVILPYKNKTLMLDVVTADIFTSDFKVYTDKAPGGLPQQTSAFYRGVVRGTNASASISFFADQIEGYITLDQSTSIEITKITGMNATNQHVVYDDADLLVKGTAHYCNVLNPPAAEMQKQLNPNTNKTTATEFPCVTNYWETAYSVYQNFGTTTKVSAFITSLFNVYATLYANEKISMKLNASFIWTTQDPYNDDLSTFSNNRKNFGANTAVLLSNAALGGVAWLNTICQTSDTYRHAYCGSIARYETVLPITSYSWPVMVTCHEVGHNLGSPHTHACAWNGNNTAIDGCGPAAGYSEGCNGPIPKTGGTVMSYCHLVSVGINLNKGFGQQPGDLIRSVIASCITQTCPRITKKCNAPAHLITSQITATSAFVNWGDVKGAAYYYIYLSSDGGSTFTLVADNLYVSSFKLKNLTANHNYICDVWVSCGNGTYNMSETTFTTSASFAENNVTDIANVFSIMPNPVHNNQFTVSLMKGYENAFVEVINSNNQVVYQSRGSNALRTFAAPPTKGLYYIRVTVNNQITTEKFLVE